LYAYEKYVEKEEGEREREREREREGGRKEGRERPFHNQIHIEMGCAERNLQHVNIYPTMHLYLL